MWVILLAHYDIRGILVAGVRDDDGVAQHTTGRHRVGKIGLSNGQHRSGVYSGRHGGRKRSVASFAQPIGVELDPIGEHRTIRQRTGGADGDGDGIRPADRNAAERPVAGAGDPLRGRCRSDVDDVAVQEVADNDVRRRQVAGVGIENSVSEQVARLHRVGIVAVGQVHQR